MLLRTGIGIAFLAVALLGQSQQGQLPPTPDIGSIERTTPVATLPTAATATVGRVYRWIGATSANTCPAAGAGGSRGSAVALCITHDRVNWQALIERGTDGSVAIGTTVLPIWVDVKAEGAKGDGTTDDTAAWAAAISAAASGNGVVYCPSGIFSISSLTVPSNIQIMGPERADYTFPGRCELKASASSAMLTLANGVDFVTIQHVKINGNRIATVGILMDRTSSVQILGNWFSGFANSNAAIRGGGTLFTDIKDNTFDSGTLGYAMDFQNSYSGAPSSTYYGLNVGTVSGNRIYARNGVRIGGIVTFENNDLEMLLDNPALAAANFCEPKPANTLARVTGNYFEIARGTAGHLAAITNGCGQVSMLIESNQIYGDNSTGSKAIDLDSNGYVYTAETDDNFIQGWATGVSFYGSQTRGSASSFRNNSFNSVAAPYTSDVTNTLMATATNGPIAFSQTNAGFTFQGRAIIPTVRYGTNLTIIDLSKGNQWQLAGSSPHTLGAATNKTPGTFFFVQFTSSLTTVANSVFNLCGGADKTFTAGDTAIFFVDSDGVIRQAPCIH